MKSSRKVVNTGYLETSFACVACNHVQLMYHCFFEAMNLRSLSTGRWLFHLLS